MPEVRVSHLFIVFIILVLIGTPILICVGYFSIPSFDIMGWKTPSLSKKEMEQGLDTGLATAAGYTPAKSPAEAMDKFREAIQARKYKFASIYVSKDYADMLNRTNEGAAELGSVLDRIRNYGKEQGILTDKTTFFLKQLDPFPKNFKAGPAPTKKGDDKAFGRFEWEKLGGKVTNQQIATELESIDKELYQCVLCPMPIFLNPIEINKVGDAWKLKIDTNPQWEEVVNYFNTRWKTHHTGLLAFAEGMTRERYSNPGAFESEVFARLRAAKP
jgi:hypothetical protein